MLVMQPATAGGALLGSFLNKIIPSVILVICLAAILMYTAVKTVKRGLKLFAQEAAGGAAEAGVSGRQYSKTRTTTTSLDLECVAIPNNAKNIDSIPADNLILDESSAEVLAVVEAEKRVSVWKPLVLAIIVGLIA